MTGIDRIIVSSDDKVTAGEENFTVEVRRYIYDTGDVYKRQTFFKLYPQASAQELLYYVKDGVLPAIGKNYVYDGLAGKAYRCV